MMPFNAKASRAKRPCPLWVDAFQRDTQHLSADEVGAYMLILMAMWTRESCDLPNDDARLSRIARMSLRLWRDRVGPTIRAFLLVDDGVVLSKRLREEAAYVEGEVQKQSERKRGGYAKPQGNNDPYKNDKINGNKPLKDNNVQSTADITTDDPRNHPSQQPNNPTDKKEEPNGSSGISRIGILDQCVSHFNTNAEAVGWPQVAKITAPRRAALMQRIKDVGGAVAWREAITRAAASPHLTGNNDRGWRADFDWLCKPANFTKLMEGNYDPRPAKQNRTGQPADMRTHRPDPALANIARLAGIA